MNIKFIAKTNSVPPMINTAKFRLPNGKEVIIDRDSTWYSFKEISPGVLRLDMTWKKCYIWDGEEAAYFHDETGLPEGTQFVELEIEDDAEEDYYVNVMECHIETLSRYQQLK